MTPLRKSHVNPLNIRNIFPSRQSKRHRHAFHFGRMTHDSKENSLRAREGTTIPAHNASRPAGTSATGFPVSVSQRQSEASAHIGYHLHPGPRAGAGLD